MPLSITKPTVGGDSGAWGTILNTALDAIKTFVDGVETTANAAMPKSGGTFTGNIKIDRATAEIHDCGSSPGAALNSSDGYDLDNGNYFFVTLDSNVTVAVPANVAASGTLHAWVLEINQSSSFTVSWNSAYKWPGGTAPTQTTGLGAKDVYLCWTRDGGTNIYAVRIAEALS